MYLIKYKSLHSVTQRQINTTYQKYITLSDTNNTNDPLNFWSFVQFKRGHCRIPSSMKNLDVTFSNQQKIVDAFRDFFNSVYVVSRPVVHFLSAN